MVKKEDEIKRKLNGSNLKKKSGQTIPKVMLFPFRYYIPICWNFVIFRQCFFFNNQVLVCDIAFSV